MPDTMFAEIFWQFKQRLATELSQEPATAIEDIDSFFKRYVHTNQGRANYAAERWYLNCEWLFAMLEVAASSGCMMQASDSEILSITSTLSGARYLFPKASSWRLGLVNDYLGRFKDRDVESAGCDDRLLPVMSEYMALVNEFQASRAGRSFRDWVKESKDSEATLQGQSERSVLQGLVRGDDRTSSLVLAGASELMALIENCHARLAELRANTNLQSACWCFFHEALFSQPRVFEQAALIQCFHRAPSELLNTFNQGDRHAEDDYGNSVERLPEINSRCDRLQNLWNELINESQWTANRTKSTWSEVVNQLKGDHW